MQAMVYTPDTPRQAHLILELTFESLVSMQQQQQTQDLQNVSSTQRLSNNTLLLPSSQALYDAILTLKDNDILQGVQGFLDRTFTSLRYQVELLIKNSGVDVRPQLDIMDRITSACYRVSTDDRTSLHTSRLESIIFERTLVDLLHPIWANLHPHSQRDNSGDHLEISQRIHVLLQVEELVASILIRLHTLLSQNLASRLSPHLLSLIMMALRVYDGCLLPTHLSQWCHSDITLLLVGILALLEILKLLRGIIPIGDPGGQLVSRLCELDGIDRALQAMHNSASPQNFASCKAFIVTLTEYSGIFHSAGPADALVLPGDLVPSADVLPQISYVNPLFHLMEQGDVTKCPSIARKEQQRWIIAFFYLKLLYNKQSETPEDLGQVVLEFLTSGEAFDDFYGASWIQLAWIYVRIVQASAPESMAKRSLARFKLFHGLKISIQDSRGWFAKSLLLAHLDDILVLAWDGDYTDGVSVRGFHEGLLLKLMLMWLENMSFASTESPSHIPVRHDIEQVSNLIMARSGALRSLQVVFIDICREMETKPDKIDYGRCLQILHTVCNVIQTMARITIERPIYTTHAGQEFFNYVVIATFQSLSKEALPIDVERNLWELSQFVIPLRIEGAMEIASDGIIETLDASSALGQLSVHMEAFQRAGYKNICPFFFSRIVANIRFLLICVELARDPTATFQDERFPISAIWVSLQYLVDKCLDMDWMKDAEERDSLLRPTRRAISVYAINGIILLNKIHTHLPHVNRISTEDLLLMGFCCLDIYNFFKQHDSCTRNYPELAEVITELAHRAVECRKENSSHDEDQLWQEVDAMLDLLLEALGGLLVDMINSFSAWRVLHEFRMIFEDLSSLLPCSRTNKTGNTATEPSAPSPLFASSPSMLIVTEAGENTTLSSPQQRWFQLKVRHPSYDAAVNSVSHRWKIEAESINWTLDLNQSSSDNSTVYGDMTSPSSAVNQEVRTRSGIGPSENTPYHTRLRQAALDILALRAMAAQDLALESSAN